MNSPEPLKNKIDEKEFYCNICMNDSVSLSENYFKAKDVKSAVEWLKDEIPLINIEKYRQIQKLIDEAFADVVIPKEVEKNE